MRELKADDQIVGLAVALLMRLHQRLAQRRDPRLVLLRDDDLVWIRATVRTHRHRFTAVNQLSPALTEALPAPQHFLRHAASRRAIPPFHRMDRPAIADALAVDGHTVNRLGQWRGVAHYNLIFTW